MVSISPSALCTGHADETTPCYNNKDKSLRQSSWILAHRCDFGLWNRVHHQCTLHTAHCNVLNPESRFHKLLVTGVLSQISLTLRANKECRHGLLHQKMVITYATHSIAPWLIERSSNCDTLYFTETKGESTLVAENPLEDEQWAQVAVYKCT